MPTEVEITEIVEVYSADAARIGKLDYIITYTVTTNGDTRTYALALPKEQYTTPAGAYDVEKIIRRISDIEKERIKLVGRKFTIA